MATVLGKPDPLAPLQLASFDLCGLDTVEQAVSAYRAVEELPRRTWPTPKRLKTKHITAFGRFRKGLYAEFITRVGAMGDETAAMAALEQERQAMPCSKQFSQLQHLAMKYLKQTSDLG